MGFSNQCMVPFACSTFACFSNQCMVPFVCLYLNILFYSNDLSPIFTLIPYCLDHCSFKISLEVRQYSSPKFGHLFQSYFGYSKPISFLQKFQRTAYQFQKKIHTDFVCSYIEQVDQFREISLLFTCSLIPLNNVVVCSIHIICQIYL